MNKPDDFLQRVAANQPLPGGGSAGAFTAALAAALTGKVAKLTSSKPKYRAVKERMEHLAASAGSLQFELAAAVQRDEEIYQTLLDAKRLPRISNEEIKARDEAVEYAMQQAAISMLDVARQACRVMAFTEEVVEKCQTSAVADAAAGAVLAQAAFDIAALNLKSNTASIKDNQLNREWLQELSDLQQHMRMHESNIKRSLLNRNGLRL